MNLVSFEEVTEILPIEGADRIEIAVVQGWQSVIQKEEFHIGDIVMFVPIDTVMQPAEWNKFLWNKQDPTKPFRIKTAKLRGVISQGVVFSMKILKDMPDILRKVEAGPQETDLKEIAKALGISKYEKPIPAQLAGKVKGDFPTHLVAKTDEDNLLSNIAVLEELKKAPFVHATLKMDGTSVTYIKEADGTFRVCSRNLELYDTEENVLWNMARKYELQNIMRPGSSIQGEICGPGIQKNPAGLKEIQFFMFNFKDLNAREYRSCFFRAKDAGIVGVPTVPDIKVWTKEEFQDMTIQKLQEFTNSLKYKDNDEPAEGIVLRGMTSAQETLHSRVLQKMLSVKIINQNYKD